MTTIIIMQTTKGNTMDIFINSKQHSGFYHTDSTFSFDVHSSYPGYKFWTL